MPEERLARDRGLLAGLAGLVALTHAFRRRLLGCGLPAHTQGRRNCR